MWIKIIQVKNYRVQSPGEVTNEALPVVLSPWSRDSITFPAPMCDKVWQELPASEAHLSLDVQSFYGGS